MSAAASTPLVLTEEQEAIRRVARGFVADRMPTSMLRGLRDRADADGFARGAWKEMATLGLAACAVPAKWGGGGLGLAELGVVLEECGRTLAPTPLVSTMVLGVEALVLAGSDAQRAAHVAPACAGERVIALAHDEGARHARHRVAARAERTAGGWRVHGEKTMVLDGHVADVALVVARVSGREADRDGLALFLVPRGARGLHFERLSLVDSRNAARARLEGVFVRDEDVVGEPGRAADTLDAVFDRGAAALAAEMLGGACAVFEATIAYLKTRRQFGVPIGSFQALKHRAATMFCELELARSLVMAALAALDAGTADAPRLVAAAKACLGETFLHVAAEGIQMHGGIGVTDDLDVGLYYKRARVADMTLGDAAFHRDRFARLQGY
jgi:alkylation response protein AidB-like acyl-CoA dehydrogenase